MPQSVNVLFVCLGNICRSPTAHGVFQHWVDSRNLGHVIKVDSAGTAAWHCGKPPDHRSTAAARIRGYDLSSLRARQATAADFAQFDYILAMDRENLRNMQALLPADFDGVLGLFLDFAPDSLDPDGQMREVPDPYHGGSEGFEQVLDLAEAASEGLLEHIISRHGL